MTCQRLFTGATAAPQSNLPARVGLFGAASDRRVHAFRNTRGNRTHTARARAALPSRHRAAPCSGMERHGQRCWIDLLVGAVSRGRRWEAGGASLHYTPNRWLVLGISLVVTARLAFGFWRSWQAWHATSDYGSWAAESGVAGSLAAGAVVLGYYLTYWLGVRRRVRWHDERRARGS